MLRNYIITALRNILKYKLFSFINIAGLSIGLASVMLITLYIWDEIKFDSYLNQNSGLYKLELQTNFSGRGVFNSQRTAGGAAVALPIDYPELVAGAARIITRTQNMTIGDLNVSEDVAKADASFFELFQLDYIEGDSSSALSDISSAALSRSAALKYFGNTSALGQVFELDDGNSYRVTAVFEDFPRNTHIRPNIIVTQAPSNQDDVSGQPGWWMIGFNTYIQLQEGVTGADLAAVIPEFVDKYMAPRPSGQAMSEIYGFSIIPMSNVHFETAATDAGDPLLLTGFGAIAFIILSIATFNFMNMSISRTVVRAREVAVRKALGADKKHIIRQFMSETIVTVIFALFVAVVITELSIPWFNNFVAKLMTSGIFVEPSFLLAIFAVVGVVAIGAGFYPASIMSNFRPAEVLRGGKSVGPSLTKFRSFLVIGQFSVAIALIIAANIVYLQIQYSQNMDSGYVKENVVVIEGLEHPSINTSAQALRLGLLDHADILDVSLTDQAPGGRYGWMESIAVVNGETLDEPYGIRGIIIDDNFINTFGMNLVAGRGLSSERAGDYARRIGEDYSDTANILINEKAALDLGLGSAQEAIGKTIGQEQVYTIVGVVGDFLLGSSKGNMEAIHFLMDEQGTRMLSLRFKTNDVQAVMNYVDQTWAGIAGDRPIRREFLDDRIAGLYQVEQHQGEIFTLFAGLSVLVSLIGLYGLASFSVARRTKEIGLRKTLGATAGIITRHILWDFSKPVLIANIIAWPIAFYFMSSWLTQFNYRIDLNIGLFALAGLLVLGLAWLTVSIHTVRLARSNPIHALRHE